MNKSHKPINLSKRKKQELLEMARLEISQRRKALSEAEASGIIKLSDKSTGRTPSGPVKVSRFDGETGKPLQRAGTAALKADIVREVGRLAADLLNIANNHHKKGSKHTTARLYAVQAKLSALLGDI